MPTANAEGPWSIRTYLTTRLAEAFATPPSGAIWPSACAVGARRKAAKNRYTHHDVGHQIASLAFAAAAQNATVALP